MLTLTLKNPLLHNRSGCNRGCEGREKQTRVQVLWGIGALWVGVPSRSEYDSRETTGVYICLVDHSRDCNSP